MGSVWVGSYIMNRVCPIEREQGHRVTRYASTCEKYSNFLKFGLDGVSDRGSNGDSGDFPRDLSDFSPLMRGM